MNEELEKIDQLLSMLNQELEWANAHSEEISTDEFKGYTNGLIQAIRFIEIIKKSKNNDSK